MEVTTILIAVIIPSAFASFLGFFIFASYLMRKKNLAWQNSYGTSIYFFDISNRSYKTVKNSFNQHQLHKKIKEKTWKSINDFYIRAFSDPKNQKKFRTLLESFDKGAEEGKISIKKEVAKNNIIFFEYEFFKNKDNDYYVCIEKWKTVNPISEYLENNVNYLKNEDILNYDSPYKGFIAFNINPFEDVADRKIVDIIESFDNKIGLRWLKKSHFIINNGILILLISANNKKGIQKKIYRFIKIFHAAKIGRLGKRYYNGSAVAYTKNVTNRKSLQKMYASLEFLINKSIEEKEEFAAHANKLNRDDFNSFALAYRIFKTALRNHQFSFDNKPVRYWSTNKKIASYAYIKIDGINSKMVRRIIHNIKNRNLMLDSIVQAVGVNEEIDYPVLVDVRAQWLMLNQQRLKYKKAIYVVNLNRNKPISEVLKIIKKLKDENFVFAIKIRKYNKNISALLEQIEPQFLIISKAIKDEKQMYPPKLIINLMTLNKVCKIKKIKIIYDNPPNYIDPITTHKIGLKFYYK